MSAGSFTRNLHVLEKGRKARILVSKLGRFGQPDSIVPDVANPQAFNRFSYVINNPARFVDPSGHGYDSIDDERNALVNQLKLIGIDGTNWSMYELRKTVRSLKSGGVDFEKLAGLKKKVGKVVRYLDNNIEGGCSFGNDGSYVSCILTFEPGSNPELVDDLWAMAESWSEVNIDYVKFLAGLANAACLLSVQCGLKGEVAVGTGSSMLLGWAQENLTAPEALAFMSQLALYAPQSDSFVYETGIGLYSSVTIVLNVNNANLTTPTTSLSVCGTNQAGQSCGPVIVYEGGYSRNIVEWFLRLLNSTQLNKSY